MLLIWEEPNYWYIKRLHKDGGSATERLAKVSVKEVSFYYLLFYLCMRDHIGVPDSLLWTPKANAKILARRDRIEGLCFNA